MSKFLTTKNTDNVYFRNLVITILNLLNEKIRIKHVISKTDDRLITIPFFFGANGDERFMQDLFLQQTINDFIDVKVVEGNTDVLPRGHMTIASIGINQGSLTQKFTFGEFTRENDGELLTYYAPINWIPLSITLNIEMHVDTKLALFKIMEQIMDVFYKVLPFKFLYSGLVVEGRIGFPETQAYDIKNEFTFPDPTRMSFPIDLECEVYKPIINEEQAVLKSKRIEQFEINTFVLPDEDFNVRHGDITKYQYDKTQENNTLLIRNYNVANNLKSNLFFNQGFITGNRAPVLDDVYSQISGSNQIYKDLNSTQIKTYLRRNIFEENYGPTNITHENYIPPENIAEINVDQNIHYVNQFGVPTTTLNENVILNADNEGIIPNN